MTPLIHTCQNKKQCFLWADKVTEMWHNSIFYSVKIHIFITNKSSELHFEKLRWKYLWSSIQISPACLLCLYSKFNKSFSKKTLANTVFQSCDIFILIQSSHRHNAHISLMLVFNSSTKREGCTHSRRIMQTYYLNLFISQISIIDLNWKSM